MVVTTTVLYGGTFDPVHNGHIAVANAVALALAVPVSLLPAADPAHRARPGASAAQRLAMLELACAGQALLRVDGRELERRGPTFTIDTLTEVRAELGPDAPLVWVLGADSLRSLGQWKRWRELFDLAHLLAFERAEHPITPAALALAAPEVAAQVQARQCLPEQLRQRPAGGFARLAPTVPLPESATGIRQRLREGGDWRAWLNPGVADYILTHRLYHVSGV